MHTMLQQSRSVVYWAALFSGYSVFYFSQFILFHVNVETHIVELSVSNITLLI